MRIMIRIGRIRFLDFITVFMVLWYINPMAMDFYNWTVFGVVALVWVFISLYEDAQALIKAVVNVPVGLYAVYIGLLLVYSASGHAPFYKQALSIPFAFIIGQYYFLSNRKNNLRGIVILTYIYIFAITINTIIQLFSNPNLSRLLAGGNSAQTIDLVSPFNGGYTFIYITVFLSVSALSFLFMLGRIQSKLLKVAIILQIIFGTILVLLAQYTTALFLLFVGYYSVILFLSKGIKVKVIGGIMFAALMLVLLSGNIPDIIQGLARAFPEGQLRDHLNEIAMVAKYGKSSADSLTRVQILKKTMELFYEEPLFGMGYSHNHNEFADALAQYGLVGALPYFSALLLMSKKVIRSYGEKVDRGSLVLSFLLFGVLFVLNPAGDGAFYVIMFFILPEITLLVDTSSKKTGVIWQTKFNSNMAYNEVTR